MARTGNRQDKQASRRIMRIARQGCTLRGGRIVTIYVDILLLLNLYVNYFLIRATMVFTHRSISTSRMLVASAVGSLFSLTIFLPEFFMVPTVLSKLGAAFLLVLILYGIQPPGDYFRSVGIFLGMNFVFAGVMLALWWLATPMNMYYNNGMVYFDISFFALAVATVAAYFLIRLIRYFLDSRAALDKHVQVIVNRGKDRVELEAILDSGNTLVDAFSGMPVIICDLSRLAHILPLDYLEAFASDDLNRLENLVQGKGELRGMRLLPYSTVGSTGVLPSFRADAVFLKGERLRARPVNALIGVSATGLTEGAYGAIVNPKLLQL